MTSNFLCQNQEKNVYFYLQFNISHAPTFVLSVYNLYTYTDYRLHIGECTPLIVHSNVPEKEPALQRI